MGEQVPSKYLGVSLSVSFHQSSTNYLHLHAAFIRTSGRLWGSSEQVMILQTSERMRQKNTLVFFIRFLSDTIHVRCVANKVALGKIFVRVIRVFSLSIFPSVLQIRLHLRICCCNQKESDENLKGPGHSSILSEVRSIGKKSTSIFLYDFIIQYAGSVQKSYKITKIKYDVCSTGQGEVQRRKYWRLL